MALLAQPIGAHQADQPKMGVISSFWRNHKVEILGGVGIAVAIAIIAAVAVFGTPVGLLGVAIPLAVISFLALTRNIWRDVSEPSKHNAVKAKQNDYSPQFLKEQREIENAIKRAHDAIASKDLIKLAQEISYLKSQQSSAYLVEQIKYFESRLIFHPKQH